MPITPAATTAGVCPRAPSWPTRPRLGGRLSGRGWGAVRAVVLALALTLLRPARGGGWRWARARLRSRVRLLSRVRLRSRRRAAAVRRVARRPHLAPRLPPVDPPHHVGRSRAPVRARCWFGLWFGLRLRLRLRLWLWLGSGSGSGALSVTGVSSSALTGSGAGGGPQGATGGGSGAGGPRRRARPRRAAARAEARAVLQLVAALVAERHPGAQSSRRSSGTSSISRFRRGVPTRSPGARGSPARARHVPNVNDRGAGPDAGSHGQAVVVAGRVALLFALLGLASPPTAAANVAPQCNAGLASQVLRTGKPISCASSAPTPMSTR